MRYKGQFQPTYFLDPENNEWNVLDDAAKKVMTEKVYCSPSKPDAVSLWRPKPQDDDGEYVDKDEDEDDEMIEGLWASDMPGVPSMEELAASMDPGKIRIYTSQAGHMVARVSFLSVCCV